MAKNKKSSVNTKKYGTFEYGDIYEYDKTQPGDRGQYLGRLVVDQDEESFYCRGEDKAARRLSRDQVGWMVAKGLVEFDHADSQDRLLDYMIKLEERKERSRKARSEAYAKGKAAKQLEADRKLIKKTKHRAHLARFIWVLGCLAIVGLAVILMIPKPDKAPVVPSIAGEGVEYPVDQDILTDVSYMTALGNGEELYGLVFDNEIIESGAQNNGESTVKENILLNAGVSSKYPLHLRPLYYDKNTFYQSQLILDDASGGSTAICLQNPDGYGLGYASNQLVLMGGRGMSRVVISDPGSFADITARQAQSDIEGRQRDLENGNESKIREQRPGAAMPEGWIGYDYADIDSARIAASFWYTKDSTSKKEDLRRKIVIWDVTSVLNSGSDATTSLEPALLNYQDVESSFFNPVISKSPVSNNSSFWLGYTKSASDGASGFYIRKYDEAEDILLESYDNTFSTRDLTDTDWPITNYTLNGDSLFFEQQGYIWVMDLSKLQVEVNGTQRTIKKEAPIKICLAREIRQTVSRDEQFIADEIGAQTTPTSHYQVMTVTTNQGVEYGIAFIEDDTGNLVFQPCTGATVATSETNKGAEGNTGTATDVSSGDQTAVDKAAAEKEASRNKSAGNSNANSNSSEIADATSANGMTAADNSTNDSSNGGGVFGADNSSTGQSPASDSGSSSSSKGVSPADSSDNGGSKGMAQDFLDGMRQSAYTVRQAADEEMDAGRILIRPGNDSAYQIICFCVRGEQFYWMEQSQKDNSRKILVSPVFYKNEAMALMSDKITEESGPAQGVQQASDQADEGVQSTRPDVITDSPNQVSNVNGISEPALASQDTEVEEDSPPDGDAVESGSDVEGDADGEGGVFGNVE